MLQLQTEVVLGWGCELTQPPTEAEQGPWPDLASSGPCLSCAASCEGWGAGPGWQPHICPAASPPSRTGEKTGGKRARKLIGQNIEGEITYQVLLGAKQTQLRELNLLFWGKS